MHRTTRAVDVPRSWLGHHSHSSVETLDHNDVRAPARLVAALALR